MEHEDLSISDETLDTPKEPSKSRLRFMAHYGGTKPLICQIKGQSIVEIYQRRGFVEIDKAEFKRLVKIVKGIED